MRDRIEITKNAMKDLNKVPKHILKGFHRWALMVEEIGIIETRKIKSFHDEPLSGDRAGQRSVRLSKAYRLFYVEGPGCKINIVRILEVNKHEY